jgi:solute carrier family 39 (zinc transporter), member 1/2/3
MDILIFKLLMALMIVITALFGGYLAFKIKQSPKSSLYFSLGNTFAAGIFLGAGLIHMLPDAEQGFTSVINNNFPFASFVASIGFLLILFIEKVLLSNEDDSFTETEDINSQSSAYVLIFILSIHSIIVGIAFGSEMRIEQSIIIAIAVLAHKGSAAFALGVNILKSKMITARITQLIIMFSFMTPLGILLGILLAHILTGKAVEFSIAVFDALAAGTFLYVAIMEIFSEEFSKKKFISLKLFLAISGLLLMALLAIWL